jgi:hypothetical protein
MSGHSETTAERNARLDQAAAAAAAKQSAKDAANDKAVAEARAKETPEARMKREAEEAAERGTADQLGRVEELRTILAHADTAYTSAVSSVAHRLQALEAAAANADVSKAVKAVADEFELDLEKARLMQPKAKK